MIGYSNITQWQANLRILDVEEIKTVPYVPLSHPFVERLIGTIRRECLDRNGRSVAADRFVSFCLLPARSRPTHGGFLATNVTIGPL